MNDTFPLRRVINTRDVTTKYCRPGEGSRWHYLDCGHSVVTKQSAGYPRKKRCRDCFYNNPVPTRGELMAREVRVETNGLSAEKRTTLLAQAGKIIHGQS